jgi:hypothetical protein
MAPTATPSPAPTATLTQQQIRDQRAAAAMRGIAVTTHQVDACSAATSTKTFARTDAIWINLCLSGSASSGALTVAIRQGLTVVTTLANFVAQPGHTYNMAYNASNLAPGNYQVVVTFSGGTAADISLAVQ